MDLDAHVGGWKVGAAGLDAEPACLQLPAASLHADGARLQGAGWGQCGIEVAVALRLGRDLDGSAGPPALDEMLDAVAALHPAIEVMAARVPDRVALVLGPPSSLAPAELDLRQLVAYLAFDGQPVASARGAHPVGDLWRLLGWLAVHCSRRGRPLRAGQVVTTGSCTGLLFAPEGARVQAQLHGIGSVVLQM
jgi:2-keto-4-pentenoate hydratase